MDIIKLMKHNCNHLKIFKPENQSWGPVNARLISGSTVSTKTSQFGDCLKMGQGQFSVIIYINFVELDNILLHAMFHDHTTISSVREDF